MKARVIVTASLIMMAGLLGAQNMFGAFKIVTEPQGAIVTINGTNQYLGTTPTQVFPILMDQYMTYNYGIPGRSFSVQISKAGYNTITQEIFVPYNSYYQMDAINSPQVFSFYLAPQYIQPPMYYITPPPPVCQPRPWHYWYKPWPNQPQWDTNPGHKPPHHGGNNGGHGNGGHGNGNGNGHGNNYNDDHGGGNGHGSHGGSGRP